MDDLGHAGSHADRGPARPLGFLRERMLRPALAWRVKRKPLG